MLSRSEMAAQLATLMAQKTPTERNKYKFGQAYDLTVPSKSSSNYMRVKRHPLCELHNKNHLELFHQRPASFWTRSSGPEYSPKQLAVRWLQLVIQKAGLPSA